ncbi:hypothetical protein XU18_0341 [Perkinsela sp. CCAP 1560/4]|nr:hypothetical protein XU18_0341 [Perkinsela sp. CCAP 1560/4]|eukprot:KNH09656.1 hypothetical protein XU18_0341 [Perkinsela sp. CCAP 1560/4]
MSPWEKLRPAKVLNHFQIGNHSNAEIQLTWVDLLRCTLRLPSERSQVTGGAQPKKQPVLSSADLISPKKGSFHEENGELETLNVSPCAWMESMRPNFGYSIEASIGDRVRLYFDRKLQITSAIFDLPLPSVFDLGSSHMDLSGKHSNLNYADSALSFVTFDTLNESRQRRREELGVKTSNLPAALTPSRLRMMLSIMSTRGQEDGINLLCGLSTHFSNNLIYSFYGDVLRRWNSSFVYQPTQSFDLSMRIRGNSITNRGTMLECGFEYRLQSKQGNEILKRVLPSISTHAEEKNLAFTISSIHGCVAKNRCIVGMRLPTETFLFSMDAVSNCCKKIPWLGNYVGKYFSEHDSWAQWLWNHTKNYAKQARQHLAGGQCLMGLTIGGPTAKLTSLGDLSSQSFYHLWLTSSKSSWSWSPRPFISVAWE